MKFTQLQHIANYGSFGFIKIVPWQFDLAIKCSTHYKLMMWKQKDTYWMLWLKKQCYNFICWKWTGYYYAVLSICHCAVSSHSRTGRQWRTSRDTLQHSTVQCSAAASGAAMEPNTNTVAPIQGLNVQWTVKRPAKK